MKGPGPQRVSRHTIGQPLTGLNGDRVLPHEKLTVGCVDFPPHSVEVDRMQHHAVIDQHNRQPLTVPKPQWLSLRELLTVERPNESSHVAREMQNDFAARLTCIEWTAERAQVRVREHAAAIVAQAYTGIVQTARWSSRDGVDSGPPEGRRRRWGGRRLRVHLVRHRVVRRRAVSVMHRRVVHPRHVVHTLHPVGAAHVHAHVGHREQWSRVKPRHLSLHSRAWRERAERVSRTIYGLRKYRVGTIVSWLDDDVVHLGCANAKLINRHGLDVLTVCRNHDHLQARNANVEIRHRRAIDDSQPDSLAALEQSRPIACGSDAIHQVRVGIGRDVCNVGGAHPHISPHPARANIGH